MENEILGSKVEEVADLQEDESTDVYEDDYDFDDYDDSDDSDETSNELDGDEEEAKEQEVAEPAQSHEANKAFQEMRKKLEVAEAKAREAELYSTALERAAKSNGFETVDEYLSSIEAAEKEAELQKYQEAVFDPSKFEEMLNEKISNNPLMQEANRIKREQEISKQKETLRDKRFFSLLENDIDNLVRTSPNVDVQTAYNFLVGEKIDELLSRETENIKKSTIADVADKSMRGVKNVTSDGGNGADVEITSDMKFLASMFKVSPKAIAKRVSKK